MKKYIFRILVVIYNLITGPITFILTMLIGIIYGPFEYIIKGQYDPLRLINFQETNKFYLYLEKQTKE